MTLDKRLSGDSGSYSCPQPIQMLIRPAVGSAWTSQQSYCEPKLQKGTFGVIEKPV